jgi:hypothetical protein
VTSEHRIEIRDPREPPRQPPIVAATCTCGWKGPPRTGRNAQAMARADALRHEDDAARGRA